MFPEELLISCGGGCGRHRRNSPSSGVIGWRAGGGRPLLDPEHHGRRLDNRHRDLGGSSPVVAALMVSPQLIIEVAVRCPLHDRLRSRQPQALIVTFTKGRVALAGQQMTDLG